MQGPISGGVQFHREESLFVNSSTFITRRLSPLASLSLPIASSVFEISNSITSSESSETSTTNLPFGWISIVKSHSKIESHECSLVGLCFPLRLLPSGNLTSYAKNLRSSILLPDSGFFFDEERQQRGFGVGRNFGIILSVSVEQHDDFSLRNNSLAILFC